MTDAAESDDAPDPERERSLEAFDDSIDWPTLVTGVEVVTLKCGTEALVVGTETLMRHALLGHFLKADPSEVLEQVGPAGPLRRFARAGSTLWSPRAPSAHVLERFVTALGYFDVAPLLLVAMDERARRRREHSGASSPRRHAASQPSATGTSARGAGPRFPSSSTRRAPPEPSITGTCGTGTHVVSRVKADTFVPVGRDQRSDQAG